MKFGPILHVIWEQIRQHVVTQIVPPLSHSCHKGEMGRIAVVGGSKMYTGAPYFAAQSALLFGADLSFVLCAEEAAIPIKSYSPDIMVTPYYHSNLSNVVGENGSGFSFDMDIAVSMLPRIHCLIIGPGLGREVPVLHAITTIMQQAMDKNLPYVYYSPCFVAIICIYTSTHTNMYCWFASPIHTYVNSRLLVSTIFIFTLC